MQQNVNFNTKMFRFYASSPVYRKYLYNKEVYRAILCKNSSEFIIKMKLRFV